MEVSRLTLLVTPGFTTPSLYLTPAFYTHAPNRDQKCLTSHQVCRLVPQSSLHAVAILFPGGITTLLLNLLHLAPSLFPSYNQGKQLYSAGYVGVQIPANCILVCTTLLCPEQSVCVAGGGVILEVYSPTLCVPVCISVCLCGVSVWCVYVCGSVGLCSV